MTEHRASASPGKVRIVETDDPRWTEAAISQYIGVEAAK